MCPARPGSDSTHSRADRGGCSVRLGFSPRSGSESCHLPFRVPHSASAFPLTRPRVRARVRACGQKAPEAPGQNMRKGKAKAVSAKRLKKDEARRPPDGGRRTCGSAERKSAQARTTPRRQQTSVRNERKRKRGQGRSGGAKEAHRLPPKKNAEKRRRLRRQRGGRPARRIAAFQELFALRITSSDAAMMNASAHHCRPESTSPRMRNPNSAAAAGSRLMSTP